MVPVFAGSVSQINALVDPDRVAIGEQHSWLYYSDRLMNCRSA
jgi:hypothetical protein